MTRSRRALLIGFGLIAVAIVGLVSWLALRPIRPVTVVVRNDSEQPIAAVRLEHERGVEALENLGRGEAHTIQFIAGGETFYRLHIRFADGSEVSGQLRYAEAGYEYVEPITGRGYELYLRMPARY